MCNVGSTLFDLKRGVADVQHAFHFHCISRWLKTRHGELLLSVVTTWLTCSMPPRQVSWLTAMGKELADVAVDNGSCKSTADDPSSYKHSAWLITLLAHSHLTCIVDYTILGRHHLIQPCETGRCADTDGRRGMQHAECRYMRRMLCGVWSCAGYV